MAKSKKKKRKLKSLRSLNFPNEPIKKKPPTTREKLDQLFESLKQPDLTDEQIASIVNKIKHYQAVIEGKKLINEREREKKERLKKYKKGQYIRIIEGGAPGLKK